MTVLTLQYPDAYEGRLRIIASTHSKKALQTFKRVCLEEARLRTLGFLDDEVIRRDAELELKRLTELLDLLIPDEGATDGH